MLYYILDERFMGNAVKWWFLAAAVTLLVTGLLRTVASVLFRRLDGVAQLTSALWDDVVLDMVTRTQWLFQAMVGLAAGSLFVDLSETWDRRLFRTVTVVSLVQGGLWASGIINFLLVALIDQKTAHPQDPAHQTGRNLLRTIALVILWGLTGLVALSNMGVNVSGLIAGLGVGGIAIGLAIRETLVDWLACIAILLDKPFTPGDAISVDGNAGVVERIGVRTTRLRAPGGEELIFANGDLARSRLRNFKTLRERRIVFDFGVAYDTAPEKIQAVPDIVREVAAKISTLRLDRAHWLSFGEHTLRFEVVYFVTTPDYTAYVDGQQRFNLELVRALQAQEIELASGHAVRLLNEPFGAPIASS